MSVLGLQGWAIRPTTGAVDASACHAETHLIGLHLMSGRKTRVRGRRTKFGPFPSILAVRRLPPRKGVFRLEEFLICKNPECRFLASLREDDKLMRRSEFIFKVCPECRQEWSGHCPFCVQPLEVVWLDKVPSCSHCGRALQPEAHGN